MKLVREFDCPQGLKKFLKNTEKQIPRGLNPARDGKNNGLVRHS